MGIKKPPESRNITRDELDAILKRHRAWLESNGETGEQANFENAYVRDIGIIGGDLRRANLNHTNQWC